jgi:hypothetical protein
MLVRTSFLEGKGRYYKLFEPHPPAIIAQFSERVIMHQGTLRDPDVEYFDEATGMLRRPSTATSYCWLIWHRFTSVRHFEWIKPCRKRLEKEGDYD